MEKMFKGKLDKTKEYAPQQKVEEASLREEDKNFCLDTPKKIKEKPNDELFLFVKGKVKFEEIEQGKIKWGGC